MIKETLLVSTFGLLGLVTVACGSQKKDQTAEADRKSTRLNSSHSAKSRMPSSA